METRFSRNISWLRRINMYLMPESCVLVAVYFPAIESKNINLKQRWNFTYRLSAGLEFRFKQNED